MAEQIQYFPYDVPILFPKFFDVSHVANNEGGSKTCQVRPLNTSQNGWNPFSKKHLVEMILRFRGGLWTLIVSTGRQQKQNRVLVFVGQMFWKTLLNNGFKSSRESFWSVFGIMTSILERPQPNISMMSGFVNPWEPFFMHLNIPKYF